MCQILYCLILMTKTDIQPKTMRLLVTAYSDVKILIDAINYAKIYRYIKKPFTPDELLMVVETALETYQLKLDNENLITDLKDLFSGTVKAIIEALDAKDSFTLGRSRRVAFYALKLVNKMALSPAEVSQIELAGLLHDIGMIGVSDDILAKAEKLTPEEYQHIQEHVEITHNILAKIHMSDDFQQITDIACSHHEKFDGSGYYRKLKGEEIPFGGRVLAVSDVFDAITSKRHYRDKMPIEKVIDIIMKGSGSHFDPLVVEKFLAIKLTDIVKVFLTENSLILDDEDSKTLEKYNLLDLYYSIVNNCSNKLLMVFNKYYVGVDFENE